MTDELVLKLFKILCLPLRTLIGISFINSPVYTKSRAKNDQTSNQLFHLNLIQCSYIQWANVVPTGCTFLKTSRLAVVLSVALLTL